MRILSSGNHIINSGSFNLVPQKVILKWNILRCHASVCVRIYLLFQDLIVLFVWIRFLRLLQVSRQLNSARRTSFNIFISNRQLHTSMLSNTITHEFPTILSLSWHNSYFKL